MKPDGGMGGAGGYDGGAGQGGNQEIRDDMSMSSKNTLDDLESRLAALKGL
jgi:hypothetical protein